MKNTKTQNFTVRSYTAEQVTLVRELNDLGVPLKDICRLSIMKPISRQYLSRICNGTRRKVD